MGVTSEGPDPAPRVAGEMDATVDRSEAASSVDTPSSDPSKTETERTSAEDVTSDESDDDLPFAQDSGSEPPS